MPTATWDARDGTEDTCRSPECTDQRTRRGECQGLEEQAGGVQGRSAGYNKQKPEGGERSSPSADSIDDAASRHFACVRLRALDEELDQLHRSVRVGRGCRSVRAAPTIIARDCAKES